MLNNTYKLFVQKYLNTKNDYGKDSHLAKDMVSKRMDIQQSLMPDYLGFGIKCTTFLFMIQMFLRKLILNQNEIQIINSNRHSNFSFFKKLIRFHDSIYEIANVNEKIDYKRSYKSRKMDNKQYDYIVVGSGPGGSVCAREIQKAGLSVCVLESGYDFSDFEVEEFSYNQMLNQYKNAGITTTLGGINITYVEGETVGGGSEINSGLYHRTPKNILEYWKKKFHFIDSKHDSIMDYFPIIEKKLYISYFPKNKIPKASIKLKEGAKNLGWEVQEVPRWFKYASDGSCDGQKMTMSKTYLKEYIDKGGTIQDQAKVQEIKKINEYWQVDFKTPNGKRNVKAKNIVLSAGTIGTAQILKSSGLSKNAGKTFKMHPTIKVVALFDEKVNEDNMGVPVHQVKEFSPDFSFGCSISSKPYLKVAMLDHYESFGIVEEKWEHMAIYYCMIVPEGSGTIKKLPFFRDPFVRYSLTKNDKITLARGLRELCRLLISAGAKTLYPSINRSPIISTLNDLNLLPECIESLKTNLMTVHLFSSCPIGERKQLCVADSYGKVFGHDGLYISDSSILPSAPGVNPQGSIMALSHRNIKRALENQ
tara:strand:+ start:10821 stop:12593 length:1773 start_codon:yes stop_codon:yes gene_type:complete